MKRLPIFPCEWIVGVFCGLTYFLFCLYEVPLRDPYQLYVTRIKNGVGLYGAALLVQLLITRLSGIRRAQNQVTNLSWIDTWREFSQAYVTPKLLFRDFRFLNVLSLTFVAFINAKHLIPLIAYSDFGGTQRGVIWVYDEPIYQFEKWCFGGKLLSEWTIHLFGAASAELWSGVYTLFYPYVAIVVFLFILQRRERLTHEFYSTFVLTWFVGILLVYLIPTWGPCYWTPEIFQQLLPTTGVTHLQQRLWDMKSAMEHDPRSPVGAFMISGLPSLHVAIAIHGSYYLGYISPWLARVSWVFTVVTIISTLYFGWHYLVDDIASVALVYGVIRAVRLLDYRRPARDS